MPDIYRTVADAVSTVLRENNCTFDAAFSAVMQNYKHLDWTTTRREVGSMLGKRKKRKPSKVKIPKQLDLLFGRPRDEVLADAAEQEANLTRGIPAHDL
ncbi:MAG: hypothetical protein A2937_02870 [Candidatus Yonathbacteria bacterium RIFCSPLOWO2_01_FULL_47_33b]|uniref:Uncharacterized protein n=1 Tax=Candidatus Yonathbacteria bacterium RIFCSPLOWO2_01_FULL_47_33b TaxID=1802727 RepID=A0A1G2SHC1_9BACT|nr:MAG: hypothetical protein A2937_02870 [Candidatus Yonathbacteria bacterium RIFCSPLOWO2_01_FULL_47_33b]